MLYIMSKKNGSHKDMQTIKKICVKENKKFELYGIKYLSLSLTNPSLPIIDRER